MKKQLLGATAFLAILCSCQKNISPPPAELKVDPTKVMRLPQTQEEKELVANLSKITDVFKEMYKDQKNVKLVRAVLASRTVGDKAVYLRDLLIENSSLKENKVLMQKLNEQNLSLELFAKNINAKIEGTKDFQLVSYVNKIKGANSVKTVVRSAVKNTYAVGEPEGPRDSFEPEVTLYEPYPPESAEDIAYYGSVAPTLVTATADADEGMGYKPAYDNNNVLLGYEEVLVNDAFAEENPTLIIGVNGIEEEVVNNSGTPIAYEPEPPVVVPNLPRRILKVDIGDVRCTKQYDALISFTGNGGGSEIRFVRADAYMKMQDGQVVADNFFTPVPNDISRKDIRKENWKTFNAEWDGDWETDNLQEFIAVYEEDNRNTSEVGGKLTTSYSSGSTTSGSFSVGTEGNFKITYKSDDQIIFQGKLNRDVFEVMNTTDQGHGKRGGWGIRNGTSPVTFTMWHKIFTGS